MEDRKTGDEPIIRVSNGNHLLVDDRTLDLVKGYADSQRSIEADELRDILKPVLARRAIIMGLADNYRALENRRLSDPDLTISVPPLFVVRLGLQNQLTSVITDDALRGFTRTGDKSIYTDINEIKPRYQAYWQAIIENGFIPHILTNYGRGRMGGIYLKLHAPEAEIKQELGRNQQV